jgi:hypothetical protein
MLASIAFAHVWGVLQLIIAASLTRTIRIRTALLALTVGLYACAPAVILLHVIWTRPLSWLTGLSLPPLVQMSSYTLDPVIEEIVKVLPLAAPLVR